MTFLGWLSDLLERLSDLQLGDEKGTLNHLVWDFYCCNRKSGNKYTPGSTNIAGWNMDPD